jgi:hypothetical protein
MSNDYFLFLDESGHHGLKTLDQQFPVLVITGVLIKKYYYENAFTSQLNRIKKKFFKTTDVIFHSRDIRKWQKEFTSLGDPSLRQDFYDEFNDFLVRANILIISSVIRKDEYIELHGPQASSPYNIALNFILERAIYFAQKEAVSTIEIIAESRGKKEDNDLQSQFQITVNHGTKYVKPEDFKRYYSKPLSFIRKAENNLGTQIADMLAYPIAQKIAFPERINLAFAILEKKFYRSFEKDDYLGYGLKIYPKK